MLETNTIIESKIESSDWREVVKRYQKPSRWVAIGQLINTLGTYVALWVLMYVSMSFSFPWWFTGALAFVAGLFIVRTFIIFHDCGHGSFFQSQRANDIVGFITGVLCFFPYYHWRWEHSIHHASSGHLDRRGVGDIWTMTVHEYLESSRWKRFAYRLERNPFVLFVVAPLLLVLVMERYPSSKANSREKNSVYFTNLAILALAISLIWIFGLKPYLLIQLTIIAVSGSLGVWLFYIQHQFEGVYWERGENWDYADAALKGSSYYKLPKIFQWITGNIGFHHIHHLSARIPNYNLEKCHKEEKIFHGVKPITILASLKSFTYRLWDEQQKKLVSYKRIKEIKKQSQRT